MDRLLGAAAIAAIAACGNSTTAPAPPFPEMPFDPTGVWGAAITGELTGSQVSEEMTLSLTVLFDIAAQSNTVEFMGTWEWAGLSGTVNGFWNPYSDDDSFDFGDCPTSPNAACSLRLELLPPPNTCWETLNSGGAFSGPNYMSLRGGFEGPSTLMATSIEGTYWEGAFSDPCAGPVLLSIDTAGSFSST